MLVLAEQFGFDQSTGLLARANERGFASVLGHRSVRLLSGSRCFRARIRSLTEQVRTDTNRPSHPDELHDLAVWRATMAAAQEPIKVSLAFRDVLSDHDDREMRSPLFYASVTSSNRKKTQIGVRNTAG